MVATAVIGSLPWRSRGVISALDYYQSPVAESEFQCHVSTGWTTIRIIRLPNIVSKTEGPHVQATPFPHAVFRWQAHRSPLHLSTAK